MIISGIVAERDDDQDDEVDGGDGVEEPAVGVRRPCTSGSLAMTRIGKYVSGRAAADSTIEYSVTLTGSTPLQAEQHRRARIASSTTRWNRDAWRGRTVLAPRPAEVLGDDVAGRQRRLEGGAERRGEDADERHGQAELAERPTATGRATCDSWSTPMSAGAEHEVGARHDRQRQQPAEREADEHVGPVRREVPRRPALLDRAAGEEEHLVRASSPRRTGRWRSRRR